MHLKAVILAISFVATAGLPVLQNNDSTRAEASWDYSSQQANQAEDKMKLTKEADRTWKSGLETSDLYGDLYTHDIAQTQGWLAGDMRRKLTLESQRLRARLAQELRELQERLAAAFATHPTDSPAPPRDGPALLARRLRDALDSSTRELCARLGAYSRGLESEDHAPERSPAPELRARYEEAARGVSRALDDGERELAARLAEFRTEASAAAGGRRGRGDVLAALRTEAEAFLTGVRSRAESLRAGLSETPPPGEGLPQRVTWFCSSSEAQNRQFVSRIERRLEALGQDQSEALGDVPSLSPSSTGSLGEDFSPKLSALLQDILQTLN